MAKMQQLNTKKDEEKRCSTYRSQNQMDDNMLREQPYYRYGMTREEAILEEEYMNLCIDSNPMMFFEGKYTPLWKQNLYR